MRLKRFRAHSSLNSLSRQEAGHAPALRAGTKSALNSHDPFAKKLFAQKTFGITATMSRSHFGKNKARDSQKKVSAMKENRNAQEGVGRSSALGPNSHTRDLKLHSTSDQLVTLSDFRGQPVIPGAQRA